MKKKNLLLASLIVAGGIGTLSASPVALAKTDHNIIYTNPTVKYQNEKHFPVKLDPRSWAITTPVRDQHYAPVQADGYIDGQGICWSYSGNDLLTFAKQRSLHKTSVFSPNYTNKLTADGSLTTDDGSDYLNPNANVTRMIAEGGNVAAAPIMALIGYNPVLESDYSTVDDSGYATGAWASIKEKASYFQTIIDKADKSFSVSDVNLVNYDVDHKNFQNHIDEMKDQIFNNGGLGMAVQGTMVEPRRDNFTPGYFNEEHNALYFNGKDDNYFIAEKNVTLMNHAVMIVGWDDNFSKDWFKADNKPTQDGAFLVRNSWGTDFGEDGYFWVSYEDYFISASEGGFGVKVAKAAEDTPLPLIPTSNMMRVVRPGALEASEYTSTHTLVPETSDIVLANTFPTTEKKLKLDAVAVETDLDDVDYEVYIKQDGIDSTDNDPSQGAKLVARGHSKLAGIHKKSIPLTVIKKETSYTIIVVQHPKDKNPQNYSAGIIVAPAFRNSKLSNPGVSWLGYIGKNGKITNWVDMKFIDEDSRNGHGSLQGVAPYVFGYSVN